MTNECAILYGMVRRGPGMRDIYEQTGRERGSEPFGYWGNVVPGRGNSKCKGPDVVAWPISGGRMSRSGGRRGGRAQSRYTLVGVRGDCGFGSV